MYRIADIYTMTESEKSSPNLPWVEKYRPNALDELISHEDIINTIRTFIKNDKLPHLLFYGPPGTGKTSTILACAKVTHISPTCVDTFVLTVGNLPRQVVQLDGAGAERQR